MSIQNLLNQFIGGSTSGTQSTGQTTSGQSNSVVSSLANKLPGGLAGGAAAGGIMALLVGNKSARKFAGKAAGYGGAAVLGGLAFKAYQNWQQNQPPGQVQSNATQAATSQQLAASDQPISEASFQSPEVLTDNFQLTLVKAMICAAKADGHIDHVEQQRIFKAVEQMQLSTEMKALVFDLMSQPISAEQLATGIVSIEQKSELYLVSCFAIDIDSPEEQTYLDRLAFTLGLPAELAKQLQAQAQQALATAA